MKKTFVKPEMKCHKLRGNALMVISGTPCPPFHDDWQQTCPMECAYNCITESCYSLTGGSCEGHCSKIGTD